jgi:hypothetical protein
MGKIDDILESKMWAAEKSDESIWESHYLIADALIWNVLA